MAIPPVLIGAIAKSTSISHTLISPSAIRSCYCLRINSKRVERDGLHVSRRGAHPRRGREDDPAHGAAVPDAARRRLLRAGRGVGRRHVLRRQLRAQRQLHVRQERLQAHLQTEGE